MNLPIIYRKLIHLRLRAIRVFCLHHITDVFDEERMNEGDWMSTSDFKYKVLAMRHNGVEFISLTEAYHHICKDWLRCKKYVVLTFDDGYASLKEILPWLEEQQIPVTLFINGKYLDGKSYRKSPKEKYLTKKELFALTSPFIEIGSHGWEHNRATEMTAEEFAKSVKRNIGLLSEHPNYVPFWAYTYGNHTHASDEYLTKKGIVPVYINGLMNFNNSMAVHRELL